MNEKEGFMQVIDIMHNYEAHAFLDHVDERRAMRTAFAAIHDVVEAYFLSKPQEETRRRTT